MTSKKPIALAVFACLLTACGGGGSSSTPVTPPTPAPTPVPTPAPTTPPPVELGYEIVPMRTTSNAIASGGCDDSEANEASAFVDVSAAAGLCYEVAMSPEDGIPARVAGGIAVHDINDDGRLDIYVTHGRNSNGKLFSLSAEDSFTDITQDAGIAINATDHSAAFIDIDQDGYSDLLSLQEAAPWIQVFKNNGSNEFSDITDSVDLTLSKVAYSIAAGDIDSDNDLDLFFAHWDPENKQSRWEFLWQNNGANTYSDISNTVELEEFIESGDDAIEDQFSFTPIFADINQDQFPDLLVASDWSTSQVLVNNGGTGFVDQTLRQVVNDRAGMGGTVSDYDNDGDLDWFVSAIGDPREEFLTIGLFNGNRLYQNDGDGNFLNMTDYAGVRQGYWAWGTCFADINNDGFDDLFVVNGYNGWAEDQAQSGNFSQFIATRARLYINQQDGTFEEQSAELGINHTYMGRGLACYDYDRDGDVDFLIANNGESPSLYRNDTATSSNGFINIRLHGLAANPYAVGAKIYVTAGDLSMLKELQLGNHYVSQNPIEAHFGLANQSQINQIRIIWPGTSAQETIITDVDVNQFIEISHPDLAD